MHHMHMHVHKLSVAAILSNQARHESIPSSRFCIDPNYVMKFGNLWSPRASVN